MNRRTLSTAIWLLLCAMALLPGAHAASLDAKARAMRRPFIELRASGWNGAAAGIYGAQTTSDRGRPIYDIRAYGATGNGVADDTAAIDAAVSAAYAAGDGAVLYFPPGIYRRATTLLLTKPLIIKGAGIKASFLVLAARAGGATDIVVYRPATHETHSRGFGVEDITIKAENDTSGRNALVLDCVNAFISQARIRDVVLGPTGGRGLVLDNSTGRTDGIFTSTFSNVLAWNGVRLIKAGDSLRFHDLVTSGQNDLELDFIPGATNTIFTDANITTKGGITVKSGNRVTFNNLNLECVGATCTGSGGALLNVDGSPGNPVKFFRLINASIRPLLGAPLDGIRLNHVTAPTIDEVDFEVAAPHHNINITANASNGIKLYEFDLLGTSLTINNPSNKRVYNQIRLFNPDHPGIQAGTVAVDKVLARTSIDGLAATSGSGTFGLDSHVEVDAATGNKTWTLPPLARAGAGAVYGLFKVDGSANTVTLLPDPANPNSINGAASYVLRGQHKYVIVRASATQWRIWGSN